MSLYSWSYRTTVVAAGSAFVEINTPSTLGIKIYEIGITQVTGNATIIGLAKPSVAGISQTTVTAPIAEQDTGLSTAKTSICTAWGTAPVTPGGGGGGTGGTGINTSVFLRKANLIAQIGSGVIWTFPRGLYLPPNATGLNAMCLHSIIATTGFLDVWIVLDE
jgi:hypothetical protein